MAKAVIHIGMDKTGTTYIQELCAQIRSKLAAAGIFYPRGRDLVSSHHVDFAGAHGFSWRFGATEQSSKDAWAAMADDLPPPDQILFLSSEHFCYNSTATTIGRLKSWLDAHGYDDVTILVFLRNQVSWLISAYGESIKWGGKASIEEFCDANQARLAYSNLLDAWAGVFGSDSLVVVNYDAAREADPQTGILNEIWSVLGINRTVWPTLMPDKRIRDNSLSCQVLLELMRRSPFDLSRQQGYNFASTVLSQLHIAMLSPIYKAKIWLLPPKFLLSLDELQRINDEITARFRMPSPNNLSVEAAKYQESVTQISDSELMHSTMLMMLEATFHLRRANATDR
jgi:hypothetical protein